MHVFHDAFPSFFAQVVMTVIVAFILEAFLFRIQYKQKMHVDNIESASPSYANIPAYMML